MVRPCATDMDVTIGHLVMGPWHDGSRLVTVHVGKWAETWQGELMRYF